MTSPDGTSERVREVARLNSRVRCVQRLGRRGLTSACAEAVLASSSPYVAIIDADLQHDETLLPRMLEVLQKGDAEVVIGSRYTENKLSEGFTRFRQAMSFIATRLAQLILRANLSDPVSGFFMAKREVFEGCDPQPVRDRQQDPRRRFRLLETAPAVPGTALPVQGAPSRRKQARYSDGMGISRAFG